MILLESNHMVTIVAKTIPPPNKLIVNPKRNALKFEEQQQNLQLAQSRLKNLFTCKNYQIFFDAVLLEICRSFTRSLIN